MFKSIIISGLLCALFISAAGSAAAKTPLPELDEINEQLLIIGMAHEISEKCPQIKPRKWRGFFSLNALRIKVRDMGYSDDEIRAYVKSKKEQNRLRAIGHDRLAAMGAVPGDVQSYCRLGRSEIEKGTDIGSFLYE